jgi:Tfp pilus assembly PilM family ATPase
MATSRQRKAGKRAAAEPIAALDFGANALKLAEVEHGPLGPVIRTFGVLPYVRDRAGQADLAGTLEELLRRSGATARNAILVVPETDAFIVRAQHPHRHAQLSDHLQRTCAVWPMTPARDAEGYDRIDALAVPRIVVDFYGDVVRAAGRTLAGVQHVPTALGRSFAQTPRTAVVEQGAESSGWFVFDSGHLVQRRTLPYGGEALTGALALAHGWDHDTAEQHKRSLVGDPAGWPVETQHVVREFLVRWWQDLLGPLAERPAFVDRVVLTGGGTRLPALRESAFDQLGIVPEEWQLPPHAHVAEHVRPYLEPHVPVLVNSLALLVYS